MDFADAFARADGTGAAAYAKRSHNARIGFCNEEK
jgi:hypothetical protein